MDIKKIAEKNESDRTAREKISEELEKQELVAQAKKEIESFWRMFKEVSTSDGKYLDKWILLPLDRYIGRDNDERIKRLGKDRSDVECFLQWPFDKEFIFPKTLAENHDQVLWKEVIEKVLKDYNMGVVAYIDHNYGDGSPSAHFTIYKFKEVERVPNCEDLDESKNNRNGYVLSFLIFSVILLSISYYHFR